MTTGLMNEVTGCSPMQTEIYNLFVGNHLPPPGAEPQLAVAQNNSSHYTLINENNTLLSKILWYFDGELIAEDVEAFISSTPLPYGLHRIDVVAIAEGSEGYYNAAGINVTLDPSMYSLTDESSTANGVLPPRRPDPIEIDDGHKYLGAINSRISAYGVDPYTTTVTLDANCDMILKGSISGAYESIEVVNMNGEVVAQTLALPVGREFRVSGIEPGQYLVRLNKYANYNVPCHVVITEQLIEPEIELPYAINLTTISITNPYANAMVVSCNSNEYTIAAGAQSTIALADGDNMLEYWLILTGLESQHATATVICDMIAPTIELINAFEDGDWIYVNFKADEQLTTLTINGEEIYVGYGSHEDGSFHFFYKFAFLRKAPTGL